MNKPPLLQSLAFDPILGDVKLIAEAWDAGGMYQVGTFPSWNRWAEWNGIYRDDLRRHLKGDGGMAQAARLTRGNMVENSMKDYILAERAYGVPENRILRKYLLKPSLIPTITVMAMDISSIFGNAFLVENLFNYPGLSRYGLSAMLNKDINAISGVVMVLGITFIILNILSDLIVAWLDPRVRLMGGSED